MPVEYNYRISVAFHVSLCIKYLVLDILLQHVHWVVVDLTAASPARLPYAPKFAGGALRGVQKELPQLVVLKMQ